MERMSLLCSELTTAGLLPPGAALDKAAMEAAPGGDLLPALVQQWRLGQGAASDLAALRQGRRMASWLERQCASGARLTLGVPGVVNEPTVRWLGHRLAWWPRGVPPGRRVGLASSRLGYARDQETWLHLLRAACAKIDPQRDLLLAAPATTTAHYVERCAGLFGLRALRIQVDDSISLNKWVRRIRAYRAENAAWPGGEVFLSPLLAGGAAQSEPSGPAGAAPARDRALVAMSDRLMVFHVRRGGHLHKLLRARLADPGWPPASVYVALGRKLAPVDVADEMLRLGAIGWLPFDPPDDPSASRQPGSGGTAPAVGQSAVAALFGPRRARAAPIVPMPSAANWAYLTHCTRRRRGPWPDQPEQEHLDDLILARAAPDRSPLAALWRIAEQQRLAATAAAIRGGYRVVSFTAVPLADLHRLRVFRVHRGRWDFEPYGICIRRDWLERLDARPVRYGDEALWAALPPPERPFFQLQQTRLTRSASGKPPIDWTVEQEWRCVGDVDLHELPASAGLLFTPSEAESRRLAEISRWPVAVVRS